MCLIVDWHLRSTELGYRLCVCAPKRKVNYKYPLRFELFLVSNCIQLEDLGAIGTYQIPMQPQVWS